MYKIYFHDFTGNVIEEATLTLKREFCIVKAIATYQAVTLCFAREEIVTVKIVQPITFSNPTRELVQEYPEITQEVNDEIKKTVAQVYNNW